MEVQSVQSFKTCKFKNKINQYAKSNNYISEMNISKQNPDIHTISKFDTIIFTGKNHSAIIKKGNKAIGNNAKKISKEYDLKILDCFEKEDPVQAFENALKEKKMKMQAILQKYPNFRELSEEEQFSIRSIEDDDFLESIMDLTTF